MVIQSYLISENTDLLEIESQIQKYRKKILNIRPKNTSICLVRKSLFNATVLHSISCSVQHKAVLQTAQ